jgi:hypothetical protein
MATSSSETTNFETVARPPEAVHPVGTNALLISDTKIFRDKYKWYGKDNQYLLPIVLLKLILLGRIRHFIKSGIYRRGGNSCWGQ